MLKHVTAHDVQCTYCPSSILMLHCICLKAASSFDCYGDLEPSHTICVRVFYFKLRAIGLIASRRPNHSRRPTNSWGLHCELHLQEVHSEFFSLVNLLKGSPFGRINEFAPTPQKPFVLGLPTGSSPIPTYKALIALVKAQKLS